MSVFLPEEGKKGSVVFEKASLQLHRRSQVLSKSFVNAIDRMIQMCHYYHTEKNTISGVGLDIGLKHLTGRGRGGTFSRSLPN